MKKIISLFVVIATSVVLSSYTNNQSSYVYVCMGQYATVYHSSSSCKGLDNCHADIKSVTLETAQNMGRRPCKVCY